jgi:hypothetical protein
VECFVLHENHVSYFHSSDKVLDGWSQITTTGPNIFNESNFIRVNSKSFSKPSIVEFNCFFFEEFVVIFIVENLDTKHDKSGVMSSCDTNVIKIVESCTKLRTDQWVSWWIKLSSDTIWLETENTSSNIIYIISPSGDNWIPIDRCTWDSSCGKTLFETLPSFSKCDFLAIFSKSISNKGILYITV